MTIITALRAELQKAEPQAQAGEPPIAGWRVLIAGLYEFFRHQEDAQAEREQHDKYELANGGEVGEAPEPLITLAAHREAMEAQRQNFWQVLELREQLITKKDAALNACVEAAAKVGKYGAIEPICAFNHKKWKRDIGALRDAITQAQEAMK